MRISVAKVRMLIQICRVTKDDRIINKYIKIIIVGVRQEVVFVTIFSEFASFQFFHNPGKRYSQHLFIQINPKGDEKCNMYLLYLFTLYICNKISDFKNSESKF